VSNRDRPERDTSETSSLDPRTHESANARDISMRGGSPGVEPALRRRQRPPAPAQHTTPPPPGRGRPRLGQSGRPRTPTTTPSARIRLRPRPHRRSPIQHCEDMPSSRRRPRCIAGRPRAFRDAPAAGTASRRQERSCTRRIGPRRGAAVDQAMRAAAARLPQPPSRDLDHPESAPVVHGTARLQTLSLPEPTGQTSGTGSSIDAARDAVVALGYRLRGAVRTSVSPGDLVEACQRLQGGKFGTIL
jgi:hypothetical protein